MQIGAGRAYPSARRLHAHQLAAVTAPFPPRFVELENASVMREHLASTTYVSGSPGADSGSTRRRGYYNGRRR